MKRIAVYCGSASGRGGQWMAVAADVGGALARRGIGIVYGGGRRGLMGAVADAALAAGGEVIGVIPHLLRDAEMAHPGLTKLHHVETMHERKQLFTDLADGFLTLPGGVGTMDELWEAMSWAQLGYHRDPVGLLNAHGYYDHLVAFTAKMADEAFVRPQYHDLLIVERELGPLLTRMAAYAAPPPLVNGRLVEMRAEDL